MIGLLIAAIVVTGTGIGFSLFALSRAPMGYEDEQGFYFGSDPFMLVESPAEQIAEPIARQ